MNDEKNDKVEGINYAHGLSQERLTPDQVKIETARYIVEKSAEMIIMANRAGLTRLSGRLSQAHAAAEGLVERATHQMSTPSKDAD